MKHYRKELWMKTKNHREFVNITSQIRECLVESGIEEGLLLCNAMNRSAGIMCMDTDEGQQRNIENWLESMAPENTQYTQSNLYDNTHAQFKQTLVGSQLVIAISNQELDLGIFEQIFYAEFDGNQRKRILIKIIGE